MRIAWIILLVAITTGLNAQQNRLRLPAIYCDSMVLQRNKPLALIGHAPAGSHIEVRIAGQQQIAQTDSEGRFQLTLSPLPAGGPHILEFFTATDTLRFIDVMVGEVWLCSGQSNMAFPLRDDADYNYLKDSLRHSRVRLYNMQPRWEPVAVVWHRSTLDSLNRFEYFHPTQWTTCNETTAPTFSAIATRFGQMLADSLGVTVGLIQNAVGGSPIESWIDNNMLATGFPQLAQDPYGSPLVHEWTRKRMALNLSQVYTLQKQLHPYVATYLFNSAIKPLHRYGIGGVLWYQGESNVWPPLDAYAKLFGLMVDNWRQYFGDPQLPFCYVQLSSMQRNLWPEFRDLQRRIMYQIPYAYMTVSSDRGDSLDVHPRRKQDIGRRLASSALHHCYGFKQVVPSGPLYRSMDIQGSTALISFDYADKLTTADQLAPSTFEVAGPDGHFYPAKASIEGNKIRLKGQEIDTIYAVRYGWQPFTRANLINGAGMPASTFQTDKINQKINDMTEFFPDYPIHGGISAPFTGIHNRQLIVAGGCNFPNKPASEGGTKAFYDCIYRLDLDAPAGDRRWIACGPYPCTVAYGATVNTPKGIVCIGGQNECGALQRVVLLRFDKNSDTIIASPLPSLPVGLFNAGAAAIENIIYATGGDAIYRLNLDDATPYWETIVSGLSEARQQPAVFTSNGQLFMAGGYDENTAQAFTNVLRFDFDRHCWIQIGNIAPEASQPVTLVGTAVTQTNHRALFVGGVDYERFTMALQRIRNTREAEKAGDKLTVDNLKQAAKEYLSQDTNWYRFRTALLAFDGITWHTIGHYHPTARAGAGIAYDNEQLYIVCGELKPGVRSQQVSAIRIPVE